MVGASCGGTGLRYLSRVRNRGAEAAHARLSFAMAVVLQWVNSNEARLSKTVTSLERAFGSGYLLGELLYKRGMLEKKQYEALVDADDMETALQNFDVVVGALETAQVPFEKAEIGKVVMRQRGAAAKLLLAIKEIHEKACPARRPAQARPARDRAPEAVPARAALRLGL